MRPALAFRRTYFARAGIAGGLLALLVGAFAGSFRETSYADSLTIGLFVLSLAEVTYFGFFRLTPGNAARSIGMPRFDRGPAAGVRPRRARPLRTAAGGIMGVDSPAELPEIGRVLSLTYAAFMLHPVVFGAVSVTVSGELWRELLFLPVGGLAGSLFWRRIELVLTHLEEGTG